MAEDPNKITYFAATNSRGTETPFGIKRRDRARHMYVVGKTGMGKSTLLENMAIQDIRNGEGVAFIDPHGSTAEKLLTYVPEHRVKDVVYFAPFDMDYPVAFNVMEDVGYDKRHLVVSGLLAAFRKIWVDAWSARMEYILSNTLLALLEYPGSTLLDVNRMLINKAFRKKVVENVQDPIVKSFWVDEFANYTDRYTQDATPAIQNKVGQFTSNPLIRNIVGQPKSSFDIRRLMDQKKIIIMNLSKGRVGEVNATLLGSMLVTKIYLAAMSRADVPAPVLQSLPNFYFYVDEFQSFANQSFADILSEARKYKLNLIIAHQYIEQMEEEVRNAVFGNVGTTVAFRVGPFDAEVLETVFQPAFMATDLVNLGFAQIYLTLMIDGVGSAPFSATTLPPFDEPPATFVAQVIENSRKQYGKGRISVEEAIKEWQGSDPVVAAEPKARKPARQGSYNNNGNGNSNGNGNGNSNGQRAVPQNHAPRREPEPVIPQTHPQSFSPALAEERPAVNHNAKEVAQDVAHRHTMATSRSASDADAPRPAPHREPRPEPQRPALDGAKSLREALEKATGHKVEAAPKPPHAPDLKETLSKVAPKADAPKPKHNGLSEQEMRTMLAVDEIDGSQ